jgi:glucokinase
VVAPGTGLGEGFLVWDGERYQAHPSEGGHTNFGPATQDELDLLAYLLPRIGHVSWERVCSGIGIPNLYTFWREARKIKEPAWLKEALASAVDPVPIIARAGVEGKAEICVKTLELFTSILASEAGNLALKILATGGIFIGGGITPRILSTIDPQQFQRAFTHKGRFAEILARIPVYVITKPDTALFGVVCYIFEQTGDLNIR